MTLIIEAVVICDDIRQEVNGKHILIGVYGGDIVVPTMPFSIPLSVWMEYTPQALSHTSIHMKLSYNTGLLINIKAELDISDISSIGIGTPQVPVVGASDGELIVEVSDNGNVWQEVKRKKVRKGVIQGIAPSVVASPSS